MRRLAILVTIAVLILVLVGLGLRRIRAYVSDRPEHRVDLERVEVVDRPAWLTEADVAEIRRMARLTGDAGFFDPGLPGLVREAWGLSPQAAGAPKISRIHPNRLLVEVPIRRPVVAVKDWGDANAPCVLLDREAVRWPGRVPEAIPERFGRLHLVKTRDPRALGKTPRPGFAWRDPKVLHGLAVSLDLRRGLDRALADRLRIRVIDVTNVGTEEPGRSEIVLVTEDGVKIEWGRSSASPLANREKPFEKKVENLRQVFDGSMSLAGKIVKVQFDRPVLAPE